ncbi:hypothetical protein ROJ8625_03789 [Roseivivax jejudonensis]|uniref:Uncharacterized protein n=1 Tax=Roseivivax jejudonensis TaxID=1529041 RepID=A0A1X7A7K5_9RHOB|nr:hypothetical protein [Roseivivax jejudonensis]SLN72077.1 hypothetical protein ROJ8625_03789 [Roseivivax jejudonensis]
MTQAEVLPILGEDGSISSLAPLILHVYMLYPESDLDRNNAIDIALRDGAAMALGEAEEFSRFSKLIFKDAPTRTQNGRLCGCLAIQMLRNIKKYGEKKKMKAAFLVSEWVSTQRDSSGRSVSSDANNLQSKMWPKFESVAHLWAAHEILDEVTVRKALFEESNALDRFLKVSAWFQRELTVMQLVANEVPHAVPKRYMSAVTDGSFSINIPDLSDWEIARMREYRNKNAGPPR